jgi:hypothetical protein
VGSQICRLDPATPGAAHQSRAAVTADGLPVGLRIVGCRLEDTLVLRASAHPRQRHHGATAGPDRRRIKVAHLHIR